MGSRSDKTDGAAAAEEGAISPPPKGLRFNSPMAQVILVGLICFCCPGMFNALTGMGGGGQVDHAAANNANTALYTTFAISGILGGAAFNLLGPKLTLFSGSSTYVLYAGSFLYYNHRHDQSFAIAAGAILGVGAGLLWAAQGAILTSYPPPARKGSYITVFWCVFNLGGVVGGFIPFILNYDRTSAASVNDGTYVAFMAFMSAGAMLALSALPSSAVVRADGSRASETTYSDVGTEAVEVLKLFGDRRMLLLFPAAWASNFFYTYQFNHVNGEIFTLRTSGLNNAFYWGAQMVGSAGIGWALDYGSRSRRRRGFVGIAAVAVLNTAAWGGGLANQLRYLDGKWENKLDFRDSGMAYAGPFLLYLSYGLVDAAFQSLIYWVIGAMSDDGKKLSRYCGFYKGVQSAGAAVAWQVDKKKTPLLAHVVVNWALTSVSIPLLALLVAFFVEDEDGKRETGDEEVAGDRDFPSLPPKVD